MYLLSVNRTESVFWFACWWCLFSNVAQATGSPWYLQIHGHGQHLCLNWHYVGLCILTAVLVSDVRNEFSYLLNVLFEFSIWSAFYLKNQMDEFMRRPHNIGNFALTLWLVSFGVCLHIFLFWGVVLDVGNTAGMFNEPSGSSGEILMFPSWNPHQRYFPQTDQNSIKWARWSRLECFPWRGRGFPLNTE